MNRKFSFPLLFLIAFVVAFGAYIFLDALTNTTVTPNDEPIFTNVTTGMSMPAFEHSFPVVTDLSEIGTNLKQVDLSVFDYSLIESQDSNMQLAISWWGKTWEFRGTCSHIKMHVWLVMGEKSTKKIEQTEWVLIPPATMQLRFKKNGTYFDTAFSEITCSDLKWTIQ